MNNEIELLFRELPFAHGSIAVDLYPWTFILGLRQQTHAMSKQGQVWKEWSVWLGPLCVTMTFYGS